MTTPPPSYSTPVDTFRNTILYFLKAYELPALKVKKTWRKTWKNPILVTDDHPKLKNYVFNYFCFFWILMRAAWCSNVRYCPVAEMSRKQFKSEEKSSKFAKNVRFSCFFFIIERVFIKGIYRKNLKIKLLSQRFLFLIMR